MELKNNLILVESPFQLVCAIQAINEFNLTSSKNTIILKRNRISKTNEQMDEIVKHFHLQNVITIPFLGAITLSDFFLVFYLKFLLLAAKQFNYLFLGEIKNSTYRLFAANLSVKKYFFLDDGISTISVQKKILEGTSLTNLSIANKKLNDLRTFLSNILLNDNGNHITVNWYSCFNLKTIGNQNYIKHSFQSLESYSESIISSNNDMFLVGSPISEDGKLKVEDEINTISSATKHFRNQGYQVKYLVHRRESKKKLESIKELEGIEVQQHSLPLEIYFLINKIKIQNLASIISTTLQTLPLIYSLRKIYIIPVDKNLWDQEFLPTYELTIQNYLENKNIEEICI